MQQGRISAKEDSAEPSSICFQTKINFERSLLPFDVIYEVY